MVTERMQPAARPSLPPDVAALYPFKPHVFDLGGIAYNYIDEGDGEPVIMVHGNPTWSFYFRKIVQALSPSFRTVVPDHVGCGLSGRPDDSQYSYRLERRVDDLESLLEHLGITQNITLIVHDWGGMIGMGYATRHPDRIKRLIITNTSGFHLPEKKRLPLSIKACRSRVAGPFLVRGLNAFSRGAVRSCVTRRALSGPVARGYLAPYSSWENRRAVLRFVQDIPLDASHPSHAAVSAVENKLATLANVPMMILWGARDFVFDDHFLNGWRTRFPQAEVHRFAEAGHYLFEDEAEAVVPLIRRFLAANP